MWLGGFLVVLSIGCFVLSLVALHWRGYFLWLGALIVGVRLLMKGSRLR
jgi:hypothetical protein